MRSSLSLLVLSLALGVAWSQDSKEQAKTPQAQGNSSGAPATASAEGSSAKSSAAPAELKTQGYKGTLVDAKCAGGSASAGAQTTKAAGKDATADRAAGDQSQACAVSTSTSAFALRTKDGHTMLFDAVGNQRAQEAIKNKKKWADAAANGKAIQAKVSGVETGDRLTVVTIN